MLKFFKHSYLPQQIVIVVLAIILWIPGLIENTEIQVNNGIPMPLFYLFKDFLDFSPVALTLFSFIIFLVSTFLFNSILSANQLVTKYSTVGAFVFTLIMCCVPEQHTYYSFLMACPFILLIIHTLFLIYQTENPESFMLNIGLFLSFASMFYFPSIVLIVWILLAFIILEFDKIRYFMIPIVGFLIPYIFLFAWYFFDHSLLVNFQEYVNYFKQIQLSSSYISHYEWIILLITFALFLLSFFKLKFESTDKAIHIRKKINVTLILTLFAVFMLFIQQPVFSNGLILISFSIVYSIALSDIKKSRLVNVLMIVIFIAVIVNQYLPIFNIKL